MAERPIGGNPNREFADRETAEPPLGDVIPGLAKQAAIPEGLPLRAPDTTLLVRSLFDTRPIDAQDFMSGYSTVDTVNNPGPNKRGSTWFKVPDQTVAIVRHVAYAWFQLNIEILFANSTRFWLFVNGSAVPAFNFSQPPGSEAFTLSSQITMPKEGLDTHIVCPPKSLIELRSEVFSLAANPLVIFEGIISGVLLASRSLPIAQEVASK